MKHFDFKLENGSFMRVSALSEEIFRIRIEEDSVFKEPSLVRYGLIKSDWKEFVSEAVESSDSLLIKTRKARLEVSRSNGSFTLSRVDGSELVKSVAAPYSSEAAGFGATLSLSKDERIYGLGDVTRDRIQKRGFKTRMWVVNVKSYSPIPVISSTRGWALSVNTTWRHFFDVGATDEDVLKFWGRRGSLDFNLAVGDGIPALLDRITDITGKPSLLPLWGYGLTFVCNEKANAKEMLDDCMNFRREGIPCDLVGLEPGWMAKYYDTSITKDWHPDRFSIPPWVRKPGDVSGGNDQTFMGAARRLGFKVSLWLCEEYDLSYEEERQAGNPACGLKKPKTEVRSEDDFEQDEHFGHEPRRMDQITKPEQPWFEHLKKFVDDGASAFKLDGAFQVNEHPDRKYGNGMDDEEMHNLYPSILNKQMAQGFASHTGRRAMIYSSGGYLGIQRYSATWAGDTGGGSKPLISMLNHSLSGHVNTSCDMDVFNPESIHFGFLQPWSQVNSWAYWRHPWLLGDRLKKIFTDYARLRYKLIPYIYSTAYQAHLTGMPIMRPMSLVTPDDPSADSLLCQYMLGDYLLTGVFSKTLEIPAGIWFDFWTGVRIVGPAKIDSKFPEDKGGPLLVKAGALIPTWPKMDYVGQVPLDNIGLLVYPGSDSSFTLFEDDGVSLSYLNGERATTLFELKSSAGSTTLTIHPRTGSYKGMPQTRRFDIELFVDSHPKSVSLDGKAVRWSYDEASKLVKLSITEGSGPHVVKVD